MRQFYKLFMSFLKPQRKNKKTAVGQARSYRWELQIQIYTNTQTFTKFEKYLNISPTQGRGQYNLSLKCNNWTRWCCILHFQFHRCITSTTCAVAQIRRALAGLQGPSTAPLLQSCILYIYNVKLNIPRCTATWASWQIRTQYTKYTTQCTTFGTTFTTTNGTLVHIHIVVQIHNSFTHKNQNLLWSHYIVQHDCPLRSMYNILLQHLYVQLMYKFGYNICYNVCTTFVCTTFATTLCFVRSFHLGYSLLALQRNTTTTKTAW